MATEHRRYDVARAGKAIRTLLDNPDDLPQVFEIIDALPGRAPERLRKKLEASDGGVALLKEQPNIVPLLSDRAALKAMPKGSLADAYVRFVESEGISAEGIVAASIASERRWDERFQWQLDRMRDTHDLWHAVTGYHGDVLGELALLAFNLGQNWHPGIALIVSASYFRGISREHGWLLAEGFARGKRAVFLPSVRWESMLPLPVDEVRQRLRVSGLPAYEPMRTSTLREKGVVPMRAA